MPLYILACAMPKPIQKTAPTSGKEEEMFWRPGMIFSHPVLKFTQNQLPTFGTLGSGENRMDDPNSPIWMQDQSKWPLLFHAIRAHCESSQCFPPLREQGCGCSSAIPRPKSQSRGVSTSSDQAHPGPYLANQGITPQGFSLLRRLKIILRISLVFPLLLLAHCIILAVTGVAAPGSPVCQDLMTLWLKFSPIQNSVKTFQNRAATHPDVLQRVAAGVSMLFDPRQRQSTWCIAHCLRRSDS
ncbi:hypothetical protein B0H11DRAFT_489615 [Mycena galericulata]|nr:hypothetical protein B0H11DRAFT_489615 [Mycena galericulata]